MILAKLETRNWYWNISTCRFRLLPTWDHDPNTFGSVWWLWFALEWINKQWVEDCSDHGGFGVGLLEAAINNDPARPGMYYTPENLVQDPAQTGRTPGNGPSSSTGESSEGQGLEP